MQLDDLIDDRTGNAWRGLHCRMTIGDVPGRPGLRVEAGGRRLMRLMAGDGPLLWARVLPDVSGYWHLLSRNAGNARVVVPPVRFDAARAMVGAPRGASWFRSWAQYFLDGLVRSAQSPLSPGGWLLGPVNVSRRGHSSRSVLPDIESLIDDAPQALQDFTEWDFGDSLTPMLLRPLATESSDRVKALRKLARDERLPPLLFMWVSGLDRYVLLDGHDRLVASLAEGILPACLGLCSLRWRAPLAAPGAADGIVDLVKRSLEAVPAARARAQQLGRPFHPFTIDDANRVVIDAFDDRPVPIATTLAWPLSGGVSAWNAQVRAELDGLEGADREMLASSP